MAEQRSATPDPRNATLSPGKRALLFATEGVQPPSPLLLQLEDQLLLKVAAPTKALPFSVNFEMRILLPNGSIVPMRVPVLVNATTVLFDTLLTEGFLLSLTASLAGAATAGRGQVFVQAFIARNIPADIEIGWVLISDYLTTNYRPSWPGTILKSPLEGPGFIYSFHPNPPAAGLDVFMTVPALVRWRIIFMTATLGTSVAVANRFPGIFMTDGSFNLFDGRAIAAVAASLTSILQASVMPTYAPPAYGVATQYVPMPAGIILKAGSIVETKTQNIDAADQWSAINLFVEEWVDI